MRLFRNLSANETTNTSSPNQPSTKQKPPSLRRPHQQNAIKNGIIHAISRTPSRKLIRKKRMARSRIALKVGNFDANEIRSMRDHVTRESLRSRRVDACGHQRVQWSRRRTIRIMCVWVCKI